MARGCRATWETLDDAVVDDFSALVFIAPIDELLPLEPPLDPQHFFHPGQLDHSDTPGKPIQQDVEGSRFDLQNIVAAAAGDLARTHEKGAAQTIRTDLAQHWRVVYDDTAAIGRLYRRQDEVGTPYCVTVDVDSLTDAAATIRDRDSMTQERVSLADIPNRIADLVAGRAPWEGGTGALAAT